MGYGDRTEDAVLDVSRRYRACVCKNASTRLSGDILGEAHFRGRALEGCKNKCKA